VEFRSVFRAPSRKFKLLAIRNVLAHGKPYEHRFMKKCFTLHKITCKVEFRSVFHAPSRKLKILVRKVYDCAFKGGFEELRRGLHCTSTASPKASPLGASPKVLR
ncbi:hypothetical protein B296_00003770, partial [Ensete ventricosum]